MNRIQKKDDDLLPLEEYLLKGGKKLISKKMKKSKRKSKNKKRSQKKKSRN
jgi:hypothetical protein